MDEERTTAVVQRYLDELVGGAPAEPVVRALLDRAVRRLHLMCASLLHRSYPRLTRPPLNLEADELLGAVVERLLKALREARPATVRQFFALANQHMRWELNDLARRLDEQPTALPLEEGAVQAPLHGLLGNPDHRGRLGVGQPVDADQVEDLPLVLREALDRPQHAPAVRAEAGNAAQGRARDAYFRYGCNGRLLI